MAHTCPECALTCHCGGDIGDMILNLPRYENHCTHCPGPDDDEPDYDDFDDEE